MSAAQLFEHAFGFAPVVTAVASGRVNLLGEHTDYNDGFVLPAAIALVTEVAIASSRDTAFHFVSQNVAGADARVDYADGTQPAQGYGRYIHGCIEVLRRDGADIGPCTVAVHSTVPIGSGLSSSAALEVSVLRGLRELHGLECDDVQIARMAQRAEIEYAGVQCGIMDQMAASIGKPGYLLFLDTRSLATRLVPFPEGTEIIVLDSGVPRKLAASGYNERRRECEAAAAALGLASLRDIPDIDAVESLPVPLRDRARHVVSENQRVLAAAAGVDAARFGKLMVESHRSLRDDFAVSVPALDTLVDCLLQQDAVFGCKLTGAGFGGACVALIAQDTAAQVKTAALAAFSREGYRGSALL
jgi:galactokinase